MTLKNLKRGPNFFHPEHASAVGSRNSLFRDGRDEYAESALIVNEEVEKILTHISAKMPPEILSKLDVMGGVKSKLHNYYNLTLQNMFNRYLSTVEDEMAKKYRDLIDREEYEQINRYTPRLVAGILDKLGSADLFNTGSMEKSLAHVYENLQAHIEHSIHSFAHETNTAIQQKQHAGAFVEHSDAYKIVKCSFKNNQNKPSTVFDIRLAINILDSELKVPIHHYQKPIIRLLAEVISNHLHEKIDQQIQEMGESLQGESGEGLSTNHQLFEKLKALENFLGFEEMAEDENSKRYDYISKHIFDALENFSTEEAGNSLDPNSVLANVKTLLDASHIQHKGFNYMVNSLTETLDSAKMGYQYINNMKNARTCVIREYNSKDQEEIPDESFGLRLTYVDVEQLLMLREAWEKQAEELQSAIEQTALVVEKMHKRYRDQAGIKNYYDVAKEILKDPAKEATGKTESEQDNLWHELLFSQQNEAEKAAKVSLSYNDRLKQAIRLMKIKVVEMFKGQHPRDRFVLEERINFMEDQFLAFQSLVNPFHLQPGLLIEVDITSVKRQKTTLTAMANVINEFLLKISKPFVDQAIQEYPRRKAGGRSQKLDNAFGSAFEHAAAMPDEVKA